MRASGIGLGLWLAALSTLTLASPARAFVTTDGDVVAIYIKNGVEMIVNVGSIDDVEAGHPFTASLTLPTEFGGNLVGAKLIVLGMRDPNAEFQPGFARENFFYTSNTTPTAPDFFETGNATTQVDDWFGQLLDIVGTGGPVLANDPDRLVVQTSFLNSYTTQLQSLGQDKIANTVQFSTSLVIGSGLYTIKMRETTQTFNGVSIGSDTSLLGLWRGDATSTSLKFGGASVPALGPAAHALLALLLAGAATLRLRSRLA